jgi:negative regulator of sigma E activity
MKSQVPDSELDARLADALAKLPDAPVASNFTARVMQAIDLEEARARRKWKFSWHSFLPRVAVTAVAVVFAGFIFHQYEITNQRQQMANSIALVATQVPSVEALKNFDAIKRMSQPAHADDELLALYQ